MIILYPTDTVYGLGVDATDPEAIRLLQQLKGRDDKKPISIAVSDIAMMERYVVVTPLARRLAEKFLPGKLTLVLAVRADERGLDADERRIRATLAPAISAGTGTVGVRIPNHPTTLALVRERGGPITATSANVSGMPTMNSVPEILAQFGAQGSSMIYHTIDAGPLPPSTPSTVVDARGETPILIRPGAIPFSDLL